MGTPLSVIVIGTWRYHFELYILMSFVLSLHLPPCFSYLIFVFLGSLPNIHYRLLVTIYHTYAHVITVFQSHIFGATEYPTSINIWSVGCILAVGGFLYLFQISKIVGFFA